MSQAGFKPGFQPSVYLNLTDDLAHSATTAGRLQACNGCNEIPINYFQKRLPATVVYFHQLWGAVHTRKLVEILS